jgi:hypothetical protein
MGKLLLTSAAIALSNVWSSGADVVPRFHIEMLPETLSPEISGGQDHSTLLAARSDHLRTLVAIPYETGSGRASCGSCNGDELISRYRSCCGMLTNSKTV